MRLKKDCKMTKIFYEGPILAKNENILKEPQNAKDRRYSNETQKE